jgi:hypothetical protein
MLWKHIAFILAGGCMGGLIGLVIMLTTSNKMDLLSPGILIGSLIGELVLGFHASTRP